MTARDRLTDREFDTHVYPLAVENWHDAHGLLLGERPLTDPEYDEIDRWAADLRESYDTGETPVSWR